MIPSAAEAAQLAKLMPNCRARVLQFRGHAVLQEAGVDLMSIIREEDFLVRRRVLTGKPEASQGRRKAGGFGRCELARPFYPCAMPHACALHRCVAHQALRRRRQSRPHLIFAPCAGPCR